MLGMVVGFPFLALVPALALLALSAWSGSRVARDAGIAWLGYGIYEYGMKARILCSGECNIRVDLLLIYPVLLAWSAAAVVLAVRMRRFRRSRASE